jgi:hypothetical protein
MRPLGRDWDCKSTQLTGCSCSVDPQTEPTSPQVAFALGRCLFALAAQEDPPPMPLYQLNIRNTDHFEDHEGVDLPNT